jgi:RNA-binding protein
MELTPRERSSLRAAAHPLRPVVLIGDNGLTSAVLKEIDLNLSAHELIKVRAGSADREERDAMLTNICETLSCATVHHLGKMLILYRPGSKGTYLKPAAELTTPAKRKPNEPHTPKKLAAVGKKLQKPSRRDRPDREPTDLTTADRPTVYSGDRPARPTKRTTSTKDTAHGIPRRSGSALSLRAGARRAPLGSTARKRTSIKHR